MPSVSASESRIPEVMRSYSATRILEQKWKKIMMYFVMVLSQISKGTNAIWMIVNHLMK